MHKYFAEWYKAAGIELKADDLEKRWQAIEGFTNDLEVRNGLELVRVFYSRPNQVEDFVERYTSSFQDVDKNFPMRNNKLELQVLSGATLVHIVETSRTTVTDAVALGVVSAYCHGIRKDLLNSEIVDYARMYLMTESAKVREGKSFHVKAPDVDLNELLETLTAAANGGAGSLKAPIRPPFLKLAAAIQSLTAAVNVMGQEFENEILARREESDILWWVFSEHSRDLEHRMSDLPLPFACLVAGKELADLVRLIPGPLAARAFLDKMLRFVDSELTTNISIKDAVNSASNDWKERLIAQRDVEGVEDLCPIHLATMKSIESGRPTGWPGSFDKSTDLKSRTPIAPCHLASQIYNERILMSAVQMAGSN